MPRLKLFTVRVSAGSLGIFQMCCKRVGLLCRCWAQWEIWPATRLMLRQLFPDLPVFSSSPLPAHLSCCRPDADVVTDGKSRRVGLAAPSIDWNLWEFQPPQGRRIPRESASDGEKETLQVATYSFLSNEQSRDEEQRRRT